ncbi:hypothetical protein [Priestia megaterium]|uniref:hypothetical protein n=1 Tax=Priestia megaterium TaxID=1404 RepID=UPI002B24A0D2|nr:hypothetical protein [Priestia megaterium]MEB2290602.1 hypothetical protein [Priestia megaterium]MEE3892080.1 hypothetical protein [Priestia megaterium]
MREMIKKYSFICTGFLFGYFLLLILGLDVSISMVKVFIPVAAAGLLVGELINMAFDHRRTDMS